jgi:hypothetical protein
VTSNWRVKMKNNLNEALDFVNENIRYGQTIKDYEIEILLEKFHLTDSEYRIVLKELDGLKITIEEKRLK